MAINLANAILNAANLKRPFKGLCYADYKAGKTTLSLSILQYLEAQGRKADEVMFVVLDCDDGLIPLLQKGAVKQDWFGAIRYEVCTNFNDIEGKTNEYLPLLKKWQLEHGPETAWIIVDNMKAAWEWARDKFCMDAYGMLEHELALAKRAEAIAAGKKGNAVFNQMADYAVINPIHNRWAEAIKMSGVNFLWLTPSSSWTERPTADEIAAGKEAETVIKPSGQNGNVGRVDQVLYLYKEGDVHYMDLKGSRTAEKLFRKMPNPSYAKLDKFLAASIAPKPAPAPVSPPPTPTVTP